MSKYSRIFMGELLGTFLMVLFGCGTVAVSVIFDACHELIQIAIMWGIGVSLAIYASRHLSCAHLNPAVTIAMAVNRRMSIQLIPLYITAQFFGAFIAGLVIYGLFSGSIADYESINGILRGSPESMLSARMFGEYYNLPGSFTVISMPNAMAAEGIGTFILVLLIFSFTDSCNLGKPDNNLVPLFIGFSVSASICIVGVFTQAGLNPARDFAPRMVAWMFGWGEAAFPDSSGGFFFVYILSPIIGGIAASLFFTKVIERLMNKDPNQDPRNCECHKK